MIATASSINQIDLESICNMETSQEVISFLKEKGYWDDDRMWRFLGDTENNYSSIGNQQSHPISSLVEKIVNSFDAILMNAGKEMGIDLQNINDPKETTDRIMNYIRKNNSTATSEKEIKDDISRLIAVSLTGARSPENPNVTIADRGEGQTPDILPDTILSLGKSNKIRIPIVQGKHNMGGSGVAKFTELQIVITRKNPSLVNPEDPRGKEWAFTVIRRTPPTDNMRSSVVEYLAPLGAIDNPKKGSIIGIEADKLPIMPNGTSLCGTEVEYGTFIKLYEYEIGPSKTSILLDNGPGHAIKLRLPKMKLPVRFCEFRFKSQKGSKNVFADGLLDHFKSNQKEEDGFPVHSTLVVQGQTLNCSVYVFKKGTFSKFLRKTGIIFSLNGQTHAMLDKAFYTRKRLKLNEIKNDTLTIVDCSHLSNAAIEKLFMNSRDRLVDSPFSEAVQKELENFLAYEPNLRRINEARIQELIKNNMADNKPLVDALKKVVKNTEVLEQLLDLGIDIPSNEKHISEEVNDSGEFIGKETPTYFRFYGQPDTHVYKGKNQVGKKSRVKFETDARNDLFTHEGSGWISDLYLLNTERARISIDHSLSLRNGTAYLLFGLPYTYEINDKVQFQIDIKDQSSGKVFSNLFELEVIKPSKESTGGGSSINPGNTSGKGNNSSERKLSLPNITTVTKEDWDKYNFSAKNVLKIIESTESLTFAFNVDNTALKSEVSSARQSLKELTKNKFVYGMTMLGLAAYSLVREDTEDNSFNTVEDVEKVCEAYAPFIIPTLNMLNSITGAED